jgi:plastocyanin
MEKKANVVMVAIVILALIIVAGAGYYLGSSGAEKKETVVPEQVVAPQTPQAPVNNQEPVVTPPVVPVSKNLTVEILNYSFVPHELTIKVGDSVTWTNRDRYAHTIVAEHVQFAPSRPLESGDSYTFTFTRAGTFNYNCRIHPDETGIIIVQ